MNKVVIAGSGLGGLECGYILSKCGMDVTVLERQQRIGGCMQSFNRSGCTFETGMHYVGGLGDGEALNNLFRYFGLMSLDWMELDRNCFDEVVIGEESFAFASGHDNFVATLSERFPREKEGLQKYVRLLKDTGDNIFGILEPNGADELSEGLFSRSAHGFLCETIGNPLLRKVLSGSSMKMDLRAESLPLYTFAQINDSFIRSAWRLKGGGSGIAENLAESIRKIGGTVRTGAEVTRIRENGGRCSGVMVNSEEFIPADIVIFDAHPGCLPALAEEDSSIRKAYLRRLRSLESTVGMFTVNIRLKPEKLKYCNRNIYIHSCRTDPWKLRPGVTDKLMISYNVPAAGEYAESIELLTPMTWGEVSRWEGTSVGQRGEAYGRFKQTKAWDCFKLAEKRLPELWEAVDKVYTSTPLTYSSYNLAPQGNAYGIRKDYKNPMMSILSPRTPLPGLLLTGQSLNLHGVLGVSMTSLLTCAQAVGMEKIKNEINPFIR